MKETLDFIKEGEQIDLLNEGSAPLHVPRVFRVIRLKLGAHGRMRRHGGGSGVEAMKSFAGM